MGSSVQRDSISAPENMEGVDDPGNSSSSRSKWAKMTSTNSWRWCLGSIYIVAVASIWIAASYIVQSVVDAGVSPFLITYICNSLFVIYIPIVEVARYFEDSINNFWTRLKGKDGANLQQSADLESVNLLQRSEGEGNAISDQSLTRLPEDTLASDENFLVQTELSVADCRKGLDAKGCWTRARVARVSMVICPFWFLAQLTFNLSLRYTTVTSNTILSCASSLFTFLVALLFLGETFTWLKLISVLLCMGGTIIVSLADLSSAVNAIATNPLLGDILPIVSAGLYTVYITLIRKKLPDEKEGQDEVSMAQFLGFPGLFNVLFFPSCCIGAEFRQAGAIPQADMGASWSDCWESWLLQGTKQEEGPSLDEASSTVDALGQVNYSGMLKKAMHEEEMLLDGTADTINVVTILLHRLGVKPHFKERGMSRTCLTA